MNTFSEENLERLFQIGEAEESEWRRLVEENREVQSELRKIRGRYHLPLASPSERIEWKDNNKSQLISDLRDLANKHNITWEKWHYELFNYAVLNVKNPIELYGKVRRMGGFPGWTFSRDGDGLKLELRAENADVNNPIIREEIKNLQILANPPPMPQQMKDNLRMKDWRPLWEWHKCHPDFSITELAQLLGYDRSYLNRKLNELEEGK